MTIFNPETHPVPFFTATHGINDFSDYLANQEVIWPLDFVLSALKASGIFDIHISDTAPSNQSMIWVDPNANAASTVKMYDADNTQWAPASFDLLAERLAAANGHDALTNNPHSVTAAQTGAYTQAQTDTAITAGIDLAFDGIADDFANLIEEYMNGVFYVDQINGDNTNDGTSSAQAFATINHALDQVGAGASVQVHLIGGYDLNAVIPISTKKLTITCANVGVVIQQNGGSFSIQKDGALFCQSGTLATQIGAGAAMINCSGDGSGKTVTLNFTNVTFGDRNLIGCGSNDVGLVQFRHTRGTISNDAAQTASQPLLIQGFSRHLFALSGSQWTNTTGASYSALFSGITYTADGAAKNAIATWF